MRRIVLAAAAAVATLGALAFFVLPSGAEREYDRAERDGRWILLMLDDGEVQSASRSEPRWTPYEQAAGLGVEDWFTATDEIAAYTTEFGGTVLNVLDGSGRRQITAPSGRTVECPAILPDGSVLWHEGHLAIGEAPAELKLLRPRASSAAAIPLPVAMQYVFCPGISTDGSRIAWRGTDFGTHVAELRGGILAGHQAFDGEYDTGIDGVLSPDGKRVYYDFGSQLRVLETDTGVDRSILDGISISEIVAVSPDGRWLAADPLERSSVFERARTKNEWSNSPLIAIRVTDGAVVDLGIPATPHVRWIKAPLRE